MPIHALNPLRHTLAWGILLLALAGAACDRYEHACTMELAVSLHPGGRTLRVGQSFTPRAVSSTCGGAKREPIQAEWLTTEHHVLRIDPRTGRITAIGVGSATVTATEPGNSVWLGSMTVHVKR